MPIYQFPRVAVNKSPHTWWLNETQMYALTFWMLEVYNQGTRKAAITVKALGENPSLPLLASVGCWQSLALVGYIPTISAYRVTLTSPLCIFSSVSHIVIGLRVWLLNSGWSHFELLNLIIPEKTLFPKKVTSPGSRWTYLLRSYHSIH